MPSRDVPSAVRAPIAGLLAWLLPGLGHIYLGYRKRGVILLVTIAVTFWMGIAIGGAPGTVNPTERKLWFTAELCAGCHTFAALAIGGDRTAPRDDAAVIPHWRSTDIGIHYAGVAGLLNLLIILDAIARAEGDDPNKRQARPAGGGQ